MRPSSLLLTNLRMAPVAFCNAVSDLATSLETLSERGRTVPEYDEPSIREIFVYSYRLMYRVEADTVTIIAFLHGARDFERWTRKHQ